MTGLGDVVAWLCAEAEQGLGEEPDMGGIEREVERASLEARRRAVEILAQKAADARPLACPSCARPLRVSEHHRPRTVRCQAGEVRILRSYGLCPGCGRRAYPADPGLGLQERSPASPRVQEICAMAVLRAPAGQAREDARRMTGLDIAPSTLHREARRQGERALALRDADTALARTTDGKLALDARARTPSRPFTLVIEIDAWNIRERDHWGRTRALRKAGEEPGRWHWVYTGTVFRLDQRGTTASGRPVIAERGYAATRAGLESFTAQIHAEALRRGLLRAARTLVLADGAVWIWNLAAERFPGAAERVDLYHVREHLWDLAAELHGRDTAEARQWVAPYLAWLDRRKDGALDVIADLAQLRDRLGGLTPSQSEALDREIGYFRAHCGRMDYKRGRALGEPVGSGAIESTCGQYQRRFKLPGQFWSLDGDEAFLALATLHRNGRWNQLFPHDSS